MFVLKYLYIIDNNDILHEWIVVKVSFVFCVRPFDIDSFLSFYTRFLVLSSIRQLLVLFPVLLESIKKVFIHVPFSLLLLLMIALALFGTFTQIWSIFLHL